MAAVAVAVAIFDGNDFTATRLSGLNITRLQAKTSQLAPRKQPHLHRPQEHHAAARAPPAVPPTQVPPHYRKTPSAAGTSILYSSIAKKYGNLTASISTYLLLTPFPSRIVKFTTPLRTFSSEFGAHSEGTSDGAKPCDFPVT